MLAFQGMRPPRASWALLMDLIAFVWSSDLLEVVLASLTIATTDIDAKDIKDEGDFIHDRGGCRAAFWQCSSGDRTTFLLTSDIRFRHFTHDLRRLPSGSLVLGRKNRPLYCNRSHYAFRRFLRQIVMQTMNAVNVPSPGRYRSSLIFRYTLLTSFRFLTVYFM